MNRIRVLLVVEIRLISHLFASVLEDEPDIEVAGYVPGMDEALQFLQRQTVDLALISVGLPDQDALKLTRTIVETSSSAKVLVVGLSEEKQNDTLRYIEAGASGWSPRWPFATCVATSAVSAVSDRSFGRLRANALSMTPQSSGNMAS